MKMLHVESIHEMNYYEAVMKKEREGGRVLNSIQRQSTWDIMVFKVKGGRLMVFP